MRKAMIGLILVASVVVGACAPSCKGAEQVSGTRDASPDQTTKPSSGLLLTGTIWLDMPGVAIGGETDPGGLAFTPDNLKQTLAALKKAYLAKKGLARWNELCPPSAKLYLTTEKATLAQRARKYLRKTVRVRVDPCPQLVFAGGTETPLRAFFVLRLLDVHLARRETRRELGRRAAEARIRVLYIEGAIRPEYKFLRRALSIDPNVQLISLVRVQKDRFFSHGAIDGKKLPGLPRSDEDFRMFDVIILGDLDSTYLTRDQMGKLRKFVKDGGGLLMIGGRNSFGPGGYAGTDLEAALPVVVGKRSQPRDKAAFLPMLTASGRKRPILKGLSKYFPGPASTRPAAKDVQLPDLRGCTTVVRAKPGAAVLAVHPTRRNKHGRLVVLAVRDFGAGRSAAFTADSTWQWYLRLRGLRAKAPYRLFWGQMIRWLASTRGKPKADVPPALRTDRTKSP